MLRRLCALLLITPAAHAATLSAEIKTVAGRPLAGAVVELRVAGPPPVVRGPYAVVQHNVEFEPHLLVVPVGATVSFPNEDSVRHHVYSFSKPKRFTLKLYGREQSRSVQFTEPGAVQIGCNIHDRMSGVIYVTASRFTAVADAAGRVSFAGAPVGRASLAVWEPSLRQRDHRFIQPVDVGAGGPVRVTVP